MKPSISKLLFVVSLLLSIGLNGQDIHFSQFETLSPILNPAFTGTPHLRQDGTNMRIAGIYRNQWSSLLRGASYQTYGASLDASNCISKSVSWGWGLGIVHDESGTQSGTPDGRFNTFPFQRDYVNLNGAMMVDLNSFFLSGGFRFRHTFSRLRTDELRYDEQFDGIGGFNPGIEGEFDNVDQLNSNNFDLGAGVAFLWLREQQAFIGGASMDYIYQPQDLQFIDSASPARKTRRLTLHGKYTQVAWKPNKSTIIGFILKGVYQLQSPYEQWVLRGDLFLDQGDQWALILGGGYRQSRALEGYHADALLTTIGLNFPKFSLSINYDVNISSLSEVSNHYGALEFSATYRWNRYAHKIVPKDKDICFQVP
ncbi:MAG: PorP/SprF family type IX secretion system membrane protein, partial [Bacteroidota bacterium]